MKVCLFANAQSVHIQQLAPRLAARGVAVHVVTHKPVDVPGCTVERFSIPRAGLSNLRRWESRRQSYLGSFLRRFDLVNVHFLADWGFGGDDRHLNALAAGGHLVVSAWGSDVVDPPGETPASTALTRARLDMLRRASLVTACGPSFARTVERFASLEVGSVAVAPFGVDLELFAPAAPVCGESSAGPKVGFFKGFRPVYGADRLIQAIPLIAEKIPEARFEMVGDGRDLPRCKRLAATLGVDRAVTWYGRQPHHAIPQRLSTWDLSVIPSVREAFGVAALESSAMGLPVVASNVGGLRDTVRNGETGLLVDASRPEALAETIVNLLGDPRRRGRMSAAGRAMVEREYQWCDLIERWINVYGRARQQQCVMV